MLDIRINDEGNTKLKVTGDPYLIVSYVISIVGAIYDDIKSKNKTAAMVFKECVKEDIGLAFKSNEELIKIMDGRLEELVKMMEEESQGRYTS